MSHGAIVRAEDEHEHEHEHARAKVGLDLVIGFGNLFPRSAPAFAELSGALGAEAPIQRPSTGATESLLASGSYELLPHVLVGARVPVSLGNGVTGGADGKRAIAALGNVELEAEYVLELGESTELEASLGVALPTAAGREPEAEDAMLLLEGRARTPLLQMLLQRSAAASRGYEDDALFEVDRLGVVPKLALLHHTGALQLESYLKLENQISTRSESERRNIVELIVAGFVGYRVLSPLTLGLRAWANLNFADLERVSALLLEPQLRAALGPLVASLGVLVPLASPFDEPVVAGVRLAASARF